MTENRFKIRFVNPISIWAIAWSLFQIWVVIRGPYSAMLMRPIHVCFAMGLVFLTRPTLKRYKIPKGNKYSPKWYEYIFVAAVVFCALHFILNANRMMTRMAYVDKLLTIDYVVGILMIALLIECSRRAVGTAFTIIVLVFIAYAFLGGSLPGVLGHSGQNLISFLECQIYSTSGVFGSPTSVSVSMVFYFLLFGAFLLATPAVQLFINISTVLTRKSTGGSGKASVVLAALFGMISGSAPANVSSIGSIAYPSMKDEGFDPMFSGSILAIEGTAGQLIPPVMGAAAFIMVDMTGHSYGEIMKAAILPSIVFLSGVFFLVHFYAKKNNLSREIKDITQIKKDIFKHLHLLIGVVVLVVLVIMGTTMMRAATVASLILVIACMFRKDTRISFYSILKTLESTAKSAITVAMPCAAAGVIVGVIVNTGLGLRFSSMLNALAESSILLSLLAAMFMSLILGMGMPTSAAYIMTSSLLCPTLVKLGIPVLVAHFFVFYFANLSALTPPVALASYAAGGIVDTDMWKLGLQAFKYSSVIFIIPFIFVYYPEFLGLGTSSDSLLILALSLINVFSLSIALIGYCFTPLKKVERIALYIICFAIIIPEPITTAVAVIGFVVIMINQFIQKNKKAVSI